jgi:hypothetical protein
MLSLVCLGGCSSDTTTTEDSTETTTIAEEEDTDEVEDALQKVTYLDDAYEDLWHTWYSSTDIMEFTKDGEFYWTCDDIEYCVSGTYTVDDTTISVTIDTSTIKSQYYAPTDGSYYYELGDGTLTITLVGDDTITDTYYTDKSIALGESD